MHAGLRDALGFEDVFMRFLLCDDVNPKNLLAAGLWAALADRGPGAQHWAAVVPLHRAVHPLPALFQVRALAAEGVCR